MTLLFDGTTTFLPGHGLVGPMAQSSAERLLIVAIGLQVALALPSLAALMLDDRLLNGVSVWSKPLKFQASLVLMLGTILLLLPLIETTVREGWGVWLACLLACVTASGEILYITLQAARGRASHFNAETPIEALAYGMMGIGAALLVLASLTIGLFLLLRPAPDASAGLQLGGAWGLILGSVLTLLTAFALGSGQIGGPGHWVGGVRTDAGGLLLFGWSRSGGDLRVPHFFATHIMQALPIVGLVLELVMPRLVVAGLLAAGTLSIAVVAGTFLQAVGGRPFF
ncbi:hypothetical protein HGO38_10605 [Rhizobium sp. CG5]|uniref:hypothetical protein n=1 Tax=Rhizobium sp. CG5 TaxID=2726076 RepID=UPI0020333D29|nr:hypothetical protein [Rhizobium sp. CG5]MCM2473922.1 hypothetical protein [Rhizobium sp. CG5]